jgi:hypothetical protein
MRLLAAFRMPPGNKVLPEYVRYVRTLLREDTVRSPVRLDARTKHVGQLSCRSSGGSRRVKPYGICGGRVFSEYFGFPCQSFVPPIAPQSLAFTI